MLPEVQLVFQFRLCTLPHGDNIASSVVLETILEEGIHCNPDPHFTTPVLICKHLERKSLPPNLEGCNHSSRHN